MIEEYDDCGARERKVRQKELNDAADAAIAARRKPVTDCPYCAAAVKGGAPWTGFHTDEVKRIKHHAWIVGEEYVGNSMTIVTTDAACGATFKNFMDSSD